MSEEQREAFVTPELFARLQEKAWPGNVRELRNHLEKCVRYGGSAPFSDEEGWVPASPPSPLVDLGVPFSQARQQAREDFDRRYLEALMRKHGGNVSQAAIAVGLDRTYLHRMLSRHGLQRPLKPRPSQAPRSRSRKR